MIRNWVVIPIPWLQPGKKCPYRPSITAQALAMDEYRQGATAANFCLIHNS